MKYIKFVTISFFTWFLVSCSLLRGDNKADGGTFNNPESVTQSFNQVQSLLSPMQLVITILVICYLMILVGSALLLAYQTLKRRYTAPLGLLITYGGLTGVFSLAIGTVWFLL